MTQIAQNSLATIYFRFNWESPHASHVDRFLATNVSFTRDILPVGIKSRMIGLGVGDSVSMEMDMSEVPPFKPGKILDMPRVRFIGPQDGSVVKPRMGRFYPKSFIEAVPGTRPDSVTPFRVVSVDKAGFKADLNHPMAGRKVAIRATVLDVRTPTEAAGELRRWPEIALQGPGMQAHMPDLHTDFLGDEPFYRVDESADADFYAEPIDEDTLDAPARESVRRAYGRLLDDGMKVLDLMSGHQSHIPEGLNAGSITGLGMNMHEMESNPCLTKRVVHNLNEDPNLPFEDGSFDAVLCTTGVEYLTKPFEVFEDVARVLKPGGVFAVSFSTRWYEPKVVKIWPELYEFERVGLVCQYFMRPELYTDINTASERGWPLAEEGEDRFAHGLPISEPAHMVWGFKK